jgi:hypothetical protein
MKVEMHQFGRVQVIGKKKTNVIERYSSWYRRLLRKEATDILVWTPNRIDTRWRIDWFIKINKGRLVSNKNNLDDT